MTSASTSMSAPLPRAFRAMAASAVLAESLPSSPSAEKRATSFFRSLAEACLSAGKYWSTASVGAVESPGLAAPGVPSSAWSGTAGEGASALAGLSVSVAPASAGAAGAMGAASVSAAGASEAGSEALALSGAAVSPSAGVSGAAGVVSSASGASPPTASDASEAASAVVWAGRLASSLPQAGARGIIPRHSDAETMPASSFLQGAVAALPAAARRWARRYGLVCVCMMENLAFSSLGGRRLSGKAQPQGRSWQATSF